MMLTLRDILEQAETLHADRIAVATHGTRLSYIELIARARRLAAVLREHDVVPGDRVAILARNSFRYLEVNFACVLAGAVLVPLNVRLANVELTDLMRRTACRVVFCSHPLAAEDARPITWNDDCGPGGDCEYEALIAKAGATRESSAERGPADIAQIFFTSGTTGLPKGVCLSHENLAASALDAAETLAFSASDVWLHAAPMFHLVDAFAIWGISLRGGRHVAVHFEPDKFGHVVQHEAVTKTSLPPTLLDWISRAHPGSHYDLSSLERISYGGSPIQDAVYRRCREALRCRMLQAYGLTEGSGFVCHEMPTDNPDPDTVINTVGRPTLRTQLALHDVNGDQTAAGEVGEIVIRGVRVFKEYWRDAEATRRAFSAGWYRTGDLAVMEANGRYRIVGRKKEMIISGGENVYPAEVINALLAHPAVSEAAVFGVPSERWGEEVRAVVYLGPDCVVMPSAEELARHCRNLIGGYKAPKQIKISKRPLPKTGAGKIATAEVREAFLHEDLT